MCQLPTNYDGSPLLPAREHKFKVYIPTIGFIGLGNGVLPITTNYRLNSLKIANGTLNGGYSNSMYGSGFSNKNKTIKALNDKKKEDEDSDKLDLKIYICGSPAHITFLSNKQIDFILPACSSPGTYYLNVTFG